MMKSIWLKFKLEIQLLFLMLVTLNSWFYQTEDYKYAFLVYCLIFLYLMIKQKPLSHFLVVSLFSTMSLSNKHDFKIEFGLIFIVFMYMLILVIKNKTIRFGKLTLPLLLFLIYSALSYFWSPNKTDALHGIIDMLEGIEIYFIITCGYVVIKKYHLVVISKIATFVMLTLSFEIFYNYHLYGFDKVAKSKHLVDLGWGYSNFIAVIFVLLLPLALYKFVGKNKYHPFYFLLDLVNIIGLLLTLSRGAILGFAISLLLYIILFARTKFMLRYGSILGLITYMIYKNPKFLHYYTVLKDKYLTKEFLDDNGRYPLYKLAYERFQKNPWIGDGIKSSRHMIRHFIEGRTNVHYHNFILQIAATLGIIGLLLLLYLTINWIRILFKPKDAFVLCSALSIIGGLAHQMVDVSFNLFYFGLIFYAIFAIVEVYRHYLKDDTFKLIIFQK